MERGGMAGAVFNAAKEIALDGFIGGHIKFTQMADIVADVLDTANRDGGALNASHIDATMTLDNVREVNHLARKAAQAAIKNRAG
jgi:1-deoxy-D-xylulose-5-phosphate reductoisomerase